MKKKTTIFLCNSCGNDFPSWSGKCPACGDWNSLQESTITLESSNSGSASRDIEFKTMAEIPSNKYDRISTKIGEFDRVLGGGIVPGSVILIGGEPGIGKSTLILQVCNNIDDCFYLSGEESLGQIKMRAERLKIENQSLILASDGNLISIEKEVKKRKPKLLIIDSIQTVYLSDVSSSSGSMLQVRECGIFLQRLAKSTGIPILIIGHVTKEGSIAGPRMLEHLVDTVLYLEGDRFHDARLIRGVKNRFGPTNEVGIFTLGEGGMIEVNNPSELFLSGKSSGSGSALSVILEGSRPLIIEIQALVVPTHFGYPKRTTSGFDLNRLNLLAAVLSKKTKYNLSNHDVYINIVGGIKVSEPAVDLAVCAAIISSVKNKPIKKELCFFGEVGLSGEIRKVNRISNRQNEANKLGFKFIDCQNKSLNNFLEEIF